MEVFVQHFHEIVNGFEITQVVIVDVYTDAEIQASVAAINDFEVAELRGNLKFLLAGNWDVSHIFPYHLNKVRMFCISHCDDSMNLFD